MTTSLHRYTLTETPELAHAIDIVLTTFDGLNGNRQVALKRIVEEGSRAVERERAKAVARRRAAIRKNAGAATGAYPDNAAALLKEDWPE